MLFQNAELWGFLFIYVSERRAFSSPGSQPAKSRNLMDYTTSFLWEMRKRWCKACFHSVLMLNSFLNRGLARFPKIAILYLQRARGGMKIL